MTASEKQGHTIVVVIIVTTIALTLTCIGICIAFEGPEVLSEQSVPFILTLVLLFFLYRGSRVARAIAAVLFGGAALLGIVGGVKLLGTHSLAFLFILMGIAYAAAFVALIASSSVNAFLKAQRRNSRPEPQAEYDSERSGKRSISI